MAILLTGGAGYIGSHTAAACAAAGYDVVIADDFSNSSPDVPRRLEEITGRKMAVCRVDAADREAMRAVFAAHSIDAVIHFAGFKAVGESVRKPVKYYRNNLDTTLTLLEGAGVQLLRHGVRRGEPLTADGGHAGGAVYQSLRKDEVFY